MRRVTKSNVLAVCVAISVLFPVAAQTQTAVPPTPEATAPGQTLARPPYSIQREDEDYRFLRDPKRRTDFWDALKFVPLNRRGTKYLSFGGEARPYFEFFENENWGAPPPAMGGGAAAMMPNPPMPNTGSATMPPMSASAGGRAVRQNDYLLQRYMLHADLHIGPTFRLFMQLKSGLVDGRAGVPRPPDKDRLDVNQLFFDFNFGTQEPSARANNGNDFPPAAPRPPLVALRVGRQELNYGAGRLVSVREGPNVRVGFDGVRAILRPNRTNARDGTGGWRADIFAARPVETNPGTFDDGTIDAESLWGVYATGPFVRPKRAESPPAEIDAQAPAPLSGQSASQSPPPAYGVDLYYFENRRRMGRFDQGAAKERRHTIGTRFFNQRQAFDYDAEFVYQFGTFGAGDIRAWAVSFRTGYTFGGRRGDLVRLGVEAGVNSGDRDPNHPDLQTFLPPAPRGSYFGQIGANGPANAAGISPTATFRPTPSLSIATSCYFFLRQSVGDALYGVPGNILRTGRQTRERYVGTQPQIEITLQADKQTSFTINYAHFYAGRFIDRTPPNKDINYFATWLTYKF